MLESSWVAFIGLLLIWAVSGWIIAGIVPLISRIDAVGKVKDIRDTVVDRTLEGSLPLGDGDVKIFIDIATYFTEHPQYFGLSEALAIHQAHRRCGIRFDEPTYDLLNAADRAWMCDRESDFSAVVAGHLIMGSRFWPLLKPLQLFALVTASHEKPKKVIDLTETSTPSPEELVEDVRATIEHKLRTGSMGSFNNNHLAGAM